MLDKNAVQQANFACHERMRVVLQASVVDTCVELLLLYFVRSMQLEDLLYKLPRRRGLSQNQATRVPLLSRGRTYSAICSGGYPGELRLEYLCRCYRTAQLSLSQTGERA